MKIIVSLVVGMNRNLFTKCVEGAKDYLLVGEKIVFIVVYGGEKIVFFHVGGLKTF